MIEDAELDQDAEPVWGGGVDFEYEEYETPSQVNKAVVISLVGVLLISVTTIAGIGPLAFLVDSDGDGIYDWDDNCPNKSNSNQMDFDGDQRGDLCDDDDDNDGTLDEFDDLPFDATEKYDTDSDGIGDNDDLDDDGDGWSDSDENICGSISVSAESVPVDTDEDGTCDSIDIDDDGDGVLDLEDAFPLNTLEWDDTDSDGFGDNEDDDDDGDGASDSREQDCQSDPYDSNSIPADWDSDTQCDVMDSDDDNDGVADSVDLCPHSAMQPAPDWDGDGCKNTEDSDDDNDGINDLMDDCPTGESGWVSNGQKDYDNDGCEDSTEDDDDDNDGITDNQDDCEKGMLSWTSDHTTDWDSDGCHDNFEDDDDDNDAIPDSSDDCERGIIGWEADSVSDWDSDGCQDSIEDIDDDNDGILDSDDLCTPFYETGWVSTSSEDWDGDGCRDSTEDYDDDNDGISDYFDDCQTGDLEWESSPDTDFDNDGCKDAGEDNDDDNDGHLDWNDWYDMGDGIIHIDITAWSADVNDCDYDYSCGSPDPYFIINVDYDCDYEDEIEYNQFDDDGTYWSDVRSLYNSSGLTSISVNLDETSTEVCFTIGVMDYDSGWSDEDDAMDYTPGAYSWYIFEVDLNTEQDITETHSAIGSGEGYQCSITYHFYVTDNN